MNAGVPDSSIPLPGHNRHVSRVLKKDVFQRSKSMEAAIAQSIAIQEALSNS